ncbi:DUF3999 domain-containing protein [Pseudomonas sp. SLFW]|uniref:DUF3999 domain-containing protein n=1 Tax=Pseudomonas sp. SLFW TaxID=2683259 RepID=UPI001412D18E|nr:DUF3999 domain-containing protein [Pseudomonas sp. SLFW]NBB13043.1 DUF3999 family protein [Pseudomonas sp. SLFW]
MKIRSSLLSRQSLVKAAVFGSMLCAALFAQAEDLPDDFASHTPLSVSGEGPWYRLELPLAAQLNARQGNLNDVRIFNADGQAQPYALTLSQPQRAEDETPVDVKWFPLYNSDDAKDAEPKIRVERTTTGTLVEVQPQGEIEAGEEILRGWLLDTSAINAPLDQLILDWNAERDGFQRFSIEASDDLQHWKRWGEGQVARLSFADERVEQRVVTLPGRNARYLRLLWTNPQSAPTLTSAQLVSTRPGVMPLSWSPSITGTVEKPSVYVWQLPVALPLERMKVDITQPNSLAPATLYGRADNNAPWQLIDDGLLYRLTQNGQEVVQDEMALPGNVVRQLKLEVDDRGGGLGNAAPKLRFAVRATQVVFLGRGAPPYSLAIGNATIKGANLPLNTLVPGVTSEKLAALGTARLTTTPVAVAAPAAPVASGPDWKRIGLWSVLVLGVIFLGWMAIGTLRASNSKR